YEWLALPIARLAKGYSLVVNLFGGIGPVPEGMSATSALRVRWLSALHRDIRDEVIAAVTTHKQQHGRNPPYWTLLQMARSARDRILSL
ncbi:MAG: hypothetical protein ACO3JL_08185, partial [Myxococcota bacterium]